MIRKSSRPPSEVGGVAPSYAPYRSTHMAMNPPDGSRNALGLQQQAPKNDEGRAGKYDHLKATVRTRCHFRTPPPSLSSFSLSYPILHSPILDSSIINPVLHLGFHRPVPIIYRCVVRTTHSLIHSLLIYSRTSLRIYHADGQFSCQWSRLWRR
jgi:hypothetical protein